MFTSSIFKIARLFLAISFLTSCTLTGIKITGQYNSKKTYLNSKLFIKDDKSFYYISVSCDLIRDKNSPYVDGLGRAVPIFRAGYNKCVVRFGVCLGVRKESHL